jgi:hypothetical protein
MHTGQWEWNPNIKLRLVFCKIELISIKFLLIPIKIPVSKELSVRVHEYHVKVLRDSGRCPCEERD